MFNGFTAREFAMMKTDKDLRNRNRFLQASVNELSAHIETLGATVDKITPDDVTVNALSIRDACIILHIAPDGTRTAVRAATGEPVTDGTRQPGDFVVLVTEREATTHYQFEHGKINA